MGQIILISGGQRSGKSCFAESLALRLAKTNDPSSEDILSESSPCTQRHIVDNGPVYIATAMIQDDEFAQRVEIHQARRGTEWINIEEPRHLSRIKMNGRILLIDCVTLWASNFFFVEDAINTHTALDQMKQEINAMIAKNPESTLIFVTNEIGLGGTSSSEVQRRFVDLLGSINQYIAAIAHQAYLVVSGIPLQLK